MLRLYYHPLSSYCWKVLIALYETGTEFERRILDPGDPQSQAELESLWPMGKFPILRDDARDLTLPESSAIIEYLDRVGRAPKPMVPHDPDEALQVRIWDRFFDNYVMTPMQKVVADTFRPDGRHDPQGVEDAKALIERAYGLLDGHLDGRDWAAAQRFSLADCAAAPSLFYANTIVPFGAHSAVERYFERLLRRPSFERCIEQARPYLHMYPLGGLERYA